jgi:hypothetical protein
MDGLENELEIEILKKNVYDLQEQLNVANKKIANLIEQTKFRWKEYDKSLNVSHVKD